MAKLENTFMFFLLTGLLIFFPCNLCARSSKTEKSFPVKSALKNQISTNDVNKKVKKLNPATIRLQKNEYIDPSEFFSLKNAVNSAFNAAYLLEFETAVGMYSNILTQTETITNRISLVLVRLGTPVIVKEPVHPDIQNILIRAHYMIRDCQQAYLLRDFKNAFIHAINLHHTINLAYALASAGAFEVRSFPLISIEQISGSMKYAVQKIMGIAPDSANYREIAQALESQNKYTLDETHINAVATEYLRKLLFNMSRMEKLMYGTETVQDDVSTSVPIQSNEIKITIHDQERLAELSALMKERRILLRDFAKALASARRVNETQ